MKKKLLAFAALAGICGAAAAQNVSIYGIIDGGIAYTNKAITACPVGSAPGAICTGSLTGFQSNGEAPSIFGLKGSEDLGGGLKANMDLEGHFLSGTGAGNQWGGLFGRQANVGLSGGWGTVTLGNIYDPAILAYAATDPRGLKESFSGLMTWAFSQVPPNGGGGTLSNANSVLDIFQKNAIEYSLQAPMGWMATNDNLDFKVSYSFGGVAGSTQAGRVIALGLSYSSPLILSASYMTENGASQAASSQSESKYSVGVGYVFDPFTVKANYLSNKDKDPATGMEIAKYKVWAVGVDWRATTEDTVTLAFYDGKNNDPFVAGTDDTARTWILSNDYALSKRTTFYALLAGVKAGSGASFGSSAFNGDNFAAGPVPGQTSIGAQLGLKHTF